MKTIIIENRFCGPPDSGNGGYVGGLISKYMQGPVEVTLKAAPPLETPLELVLSAEGAELVHNNETIVVARTISLDLDVPPPPTWQAAVRAEENFAGFCHHPLPGCFVCGTARFQGDGLRIFTGHTVDDERIAAAPWIPDESLGDESGKVGQEFIWAALDCPGYFAANIHPAPALLGRMAVDIRASLNVGEKSVVIGWPIDREGRKQHVGTAIFSETGKLVAHARATWIMLRQ